MCCLSSKQQVLTVHGSCLHTFRPWLESRCVSWCALECSASRASGWARGKSGLACSARTQCWDSIVVSCYPPSANFWWTRKCFSRGIAVESMALLELCSAQHPLACTWEWLTVTFLMSLASTYNSKKNGVWNHTFSLVVVFCSWFCAN